MYACVFDNPCGLIWTLMLQVAWFPKVAYWSIKTKKNWKAVHRQSFLKGNYFITWFLWRKVTERKLKLENQILSPFSFLGFKGQVGSVLSEKIELNLLNYTHWLLPSLPLSPSRRVHHLILKRTKRALKNFPLEKCCFKSVMLTTRIVPVTEYEQESDAIRRKIC